MSDQSLADGAVGAAADAAAAAVAGGTLAEVGDTPARRAASLTNRQKVAVLLAHLGTERAVPVLREMSDEDAITLTKEIIGLPPVTNEILADVIAEFLERVGQPVVGGSASVELVKELLVERLGAARAQEIIDQIEGQEAAGPLTSLLKVDPQQAISVLTAQQPQVIAVLLAYLPPEDAANLLSALEPELRFKVAKRIAQLTRVDPAAVRQATNLLVGQLRSVEGGGRTTSAGGAGVLAEILNHSDRTIEHEVLSEIETVDVALAEAVRANLFTFDDVLQLDDRSLQHIFRRADAETIAYAMRDAELGFDAVDRIKANLSERVTQMVNEELEVMGTARASQVKAAQSAIVRLARQLDAEGTIVIARDSEVVA